MDTPICDFVRDYIAEQTLRLHMPGHKGTATLGMEALDITEIRGADSLYEAQGIIARSEENAGRLFGCRTLYSTEGSSQCIRAMLYLVMLHAKAQGKRLRIAAGRNAHKTFLTAAGLLDLQVDWLYGKHSGYLSCELTPDALNGYLCAAVEKPAAVYVTSPDYLGKLADIRGLSEVCHRHGILLAVDNAHGAYLKFLPVAAHPMDLGADICCDSAHKTLPVLTGGAYLHLSSVLDAELGQQARNALAIFGSTSPSYLILQSLDMANVYLESYLARLQAFLPALEACKARLRQHGYVLYGQEPMKITLQTKSYGYTGLELAALLRKQNMEPEFADPDYLVLMLSAETDVQAVEQALCHIPPRTPLEEAPPVSVPAEAKLTIREAMLSPGETLPAERCLGRILAVPTVGCPPAVPILVCGEQIDEHTLTCFAYYGIDSCCVVK